MSVTQTKVKLSYRCGFALALHIWAGEFQLNSIHLHHWTLAERKPN